MWIFFIVVQLSIIAIVSVSHVMVIHPSFPVVWEQGTDVFINHHFSSKFSLWCPWWWPHSLLLCRCTHDSTLCLKISLVKGRIIYNLSSNCSTFESEKKLLLIIVLWVCPGKVQTFFSPVSKFLSPVLPCADPSPTPKCLSATLTVFQNISLLSDRPKGKKSHVYKNKWPQENET